MRIAIGTWNLRQIGGVESYLATVIPELIAARCEVSLLGEVDVPDGRPRIAPSQVPTWCITDMGRPEAIKALRQWAPDVIFMNGTPRLATQREALETAPAIFYAHSYDGICISRAKSFKVPHVRPCHRRFGAMCLLHYLPHRCGGLSPLTMLQMYRLATKQSRLLRKYKLIITDSDYLRREYLRQGFFKPAGVTTVYYPLRSASITNRITVRLENQGAARLLFFGRMTILKGGQLLIGAMAQATRALGRPLKLILAGDGPERAKWESIAEDVRRRDPRILFEFTGWLEKAKMNQLLDDAHLLVVPSLWPEPFGMVGPEAGLRGVPQAAFDVGGISEWLIDGVNGHLASGEPPTSAGLANAIVKCIEDPVEHARLRCGAFEVASRFTVNRHLESLLRALEEASHRPTITSAEARN